MEDKKVIKRRSFIMKVLWGFSAIIGLLTVIPVVGALFAPLFRKTPQAWRIVGNIDDFEVGKTVLVKYENANPLPWSGLSSESASWLHRESKDKFIAFAINCTHLGCPVRWMPDAEIFLCPCHGGVYNKDGSYAAGPPPHGLNKYPVRIKGNKVEIQTSPVPITNLG
ncbi:MAG TPA: Rieske (2Fe-2S) protein [Sunxiuqinia sp.]|nr:Rieske (2Fe-2S) protein [Sunxiuqinia sp.]